MSHCIHSNNSVNEHLLFHVNMETFKYYKAELSLTASNLHFASSQILCLPLDINNVLSKLYFIICSQQSFIAVKFEVDLLFTSLLLILALCYSPEFELFLL